MLPTYHLPFTDCVGPIIIWYDGIEDGRVELRRKLASGRRRLIWVVSRGAPPSQALSHDMEGRAWGWHWSVGGRSENDDGADRCPNAIRHGACREVGLLRAWRLGLEHT